MPLTPAEQAELAQLQADPALKGASSNLSPAEQAEMAQLQKEVGGQDTRGAIEKLFNMDRSDADDQMDAYHARHANDTIGQKVNSVVFGDSDEPGYASSGLGAATLALPLEAAPEGLAKLASYLQGTGKVAGLARVGANGAVGGIQGAMATPQGDETRMGNAAKGFGLGALGGTAGEAVTQLGGAGAYEAGKDWARMTAPQAKAFAENPGGAGANTFGSQVNSEMTGQPYQSGVKDMVRQLQDPTQLPELQDQAASAINNSRRELRKVGLGKAANLREMLSGKQVELNPNDVLGTDPRVDASLKQFEQVTPGQKGIGMLDDNNVLTYPDEVPDKITYPDSVQMDANDVNQMKRQLQERANYQQGTILDPVQKARNAAIGEKASNLRAKVEGVEPEAAGINKEMQENMNVQSALRKGLKKPLAFVSTSSPDNLATIARAENEGAGGILDFGNKLGAAKALDARDVGSGISNMAGRKLGPAGITVGHALKTSDAVAAPFIQSLLHGLFRDKKQ